MSVEGMWAIYFGDVAGGFPTPNSGVMVFETGKLFGGDSLTAYLGDFALNNGKVTAQARVWTYNPANMHEATTAFGQQGPSDNRVNFEGDYHNGDDGPRRIRGQIWEEGKPAIKLPALLLPIADLP